VQGADPGAVIAAIFHPPEAIDQPIGHWLTAGKAHNPDNPAHSEFTPMLSINKFPKFNLSITK
jgi:hypothetical protein